jgi:hypothetical protein
MTQTLTNAPVSAAAERMRRHRARRRKGLRPAHFDLELAADGRDSGSRPS